MRILRAAHLGMCFGVRDAIELAVHHSDTAPLTVLGDLVHNDAVSNTVEQWVGGKNDNIREVVIRTISRIATSGQIARPTILRRFIG